MAIHPVAARYLNPFRLATYLLILQSIGHTLGALLSTPEFGPDSDRVIAAMRSVHVDAAGSDCTWWGFYLGFGYQVTIFFTLSAIITWILGGLDRADRRKWSVLVWALFASYVASLMIAIRYFFIVPIVLQAAIVLLLGAQCLLLRREPRA
jgi:hypothetical protein